jgi:phosphoglycolate phosphatase
MALVMYDLDGTLIDTASEIAAAVNATLSQYQFNTVTEHQVKAWIGHGTVWLMQQAWPDKHDVQAQDTWKKVMQNFMQHYKNVVGTMSKPYPAALETLNKLKKQGIKQAIVTNKEEPYTSKILEQHHMKGLFDLLISGNSLSYKKPDAAVVEYCLEMLGESKENSLFVGDSEIDITTAKNAGVTCWVVPYGYNAGRDIANANPDKIINSISSVPDFFNL